MKANIQVANIQVSLTKAAGKVKSPACETNTIKLIGLDKAATLFCLLHTSVSSVAHWVQSCSCCLYTLWLCVCVHVCVLVSRVTAQRPLSPDSHLWETALGSYVIMQLRQRKKEKKCNIKKTNWIVYTTLAGAHTEVGGVEWCLVNVIEEVRRPHGRGALLRSWKPRWNSAHWRQRAVLHHRVSSLAMAATTEPKTVQRSKVRVRPKKKNRRLKEGTDLWGEGTGALCDITKDDFL